MDPDRFDVDPEPAQVGGQVTICYEHSGKPHESVEITLTNGLAPGEEGYEEVVYVVETDANGVGCVNPVPTLPNWFAHVLKGPETVDHAIPTS